MISHDMRLISQCAEEIFICDEKKITKYQGHVNNPKRMAEIAGRCFDRAMSEMGPTQLNIPRDYFYGEITCEIPKPFRLDRGPGGEKSLNEAADLLLEFGETWGYTAEHTVTQAEIDSNGGGDGLLRRPRLRRPRRAG